MQDTDQQGFLIALNTMGEFFSDELSELRQHTYWGILRERCTLEEWHYACTQAMAGETFNKVPLPKVLLGYVQEHREAHRTQRQREERADGSHTEAQLLQLREALVLPSEVRRLIESIWPEERRQS
jgi:hypothetical protein